MRLPSLSRYHPVAIADIPTVVANSLSVRVVRQVSPQVIEWVSHNKDALLDFWYHGDTWTQPEANDSFKSFKGFEPIAARQARFPQRSVRVVSDPLLASAAGLRCGTRARLLGKPRGMLSADSGVVTEMPDGAPYADLMRVPAGGMVRRRMRPAGPSTLPA
jgi:hypothetical protein